ncbi:FkbM family methyltransferase [Methylobacterium sp. E-045]|uniref:FkbM family methyltransferase n=1 Tax=Methylobacterium sp. E-045 TaxID=2836575 RepID=UPI001FB8FB77|nr:FkbM family methyltransferase [Methylobacterium sp. E-045]MCJ2132201.1 FkbM family methyltransferase [Methylobacterium sp. E-045]
MDAIRHALKDGSRRLALRAVRMGLPLPGRPFQALAEHVGLRDLIRRERIDVVLDVGANSGQFAEGLRQAGYAGRILSFEPVRRDFEAASRRMKGDRLWTGLCLALGDSEGEAAINVVPSLTVMNSLLAPITASRPIEIEQVRVRRLDAVLPDILPDFKACRILLKMDTQGYDLRCFAGAAGCLGSVRGLYSELSVLPLYAGSPHYLESLARYEEAGFDLIDLSVVSRRADAIQEMNCLMRRARDATEGPRLA